MKTRVSWSVFAAALAASTLAFAAAAPAFAGGATFGYAYDALGRLLTVTKTTSVANGSGGTNSVVYTTTYTYDSAGNRTAVSTVLSTGSTWGSFNWGSGTW